MEADSLVQVINEGAFNKDHVRGHKKDSGKLSKVFSLTWTSDWLCLGMRE